MLQNDRKITITTGQSRKATVWRPQTMTLTELYARLQTPARSTETLEQYTALRKPQQDDLKDAGGFVAGTLHGERRKASNVAGRDLLTLDMDNIPAGGTADVLQRVEALGYGYCVYSTRKHSPTAPRLRVLLPLDRTCTADEYEPLARRVASYTGMELCDPTTFEASRLMYWPSCCADGEYVYTYADKGFAPVDALLATYANWHNTQEWPQVPGAQEIPQRLAAKQADPESKKGIVGAFCRVYDVHRAIAELLPGIYEPCGNEGRYTYTAGSTTGGAVVYDGGKWLFSHHATDPCSGKLVNAYDLVRLHKFGGLDDDAKPDTPANKLPSFHAMAELAGSNAEVRRLLATEQQAQVLADFDGVAAPGTTDNAEWRAQLKISETGVPQKTIDNIWIILEHDPLLKGKFALNEFSGRGEVLGALPWCTRPERRAWQDSDNAGLYWYLEKYYNISNRGNADNALALHSEKHRFDDVRDYLQGLTWDGAPRLDTLLIDYLGAADTAYVRAATRKAFTAAVARAMDPGCKYDIMTVFSGPQGIGKSTLLYKMSKGWFNDSIRSFEGKEASELLQGSWIIEIGELNAFRKTDVNRIKQFLSLRMDKYRAAYGRHVKDFPRRCVFFGTTNSHEYLQDDTGNRRFWPIDVGVQAARKSIWTDLDKDIDQLWAEAVIHWRTGESLYLTGEVEQEARALQEDHREHSPWEGIVQAFLSREVPQDWYGWDRDKRMMFWGDGVRDGINLISRTKVCAQEIWCEALGGELKHLRYTDTKEINSIIEHTDGWKRIKKTARFGCYGAQKGFEKEV